MSFVRPIMDYGDKIYEKPNNESNRTECIHYKACIAITGAFPGTSMEHLYQELGLESFRDWYRFRKLIFFIRFYKVLLRNISLGIWGSKFYS